MWRYVGLIGCVACTSESGLTSVVPTAAPIAPAALAIWPDELRFDDPVAGDARAFTLRNAGEDALVIRGIDAYLSQELFHVGDAPLRLLDAGQETDVTVTWLGERAVAASGLITVRADGTPGSLDVRVTATAPDPATGCDTAASPFGGGAGTPQAPWQICSVEQFDAVRTAPDDAFVLTADLDLDAASIAPFPRFTGTFDGAGHALHGWFREDSAAGATLFTEISGTIRDLIVADPVVTGGQRTAVLADTLSPGAIVERVAIRGASVHGFRGVVAGVTLTVSDGAVLRDVSFEGSVTADGLDGFVSGITHQCVGRCERLTVDGVIDAGEAWKVAGIADYVSGVVSGCASRAEIYGGTRVAGVVAVLVGGRVEDCRVSGRISGTHWVGGVVAETWSGAGPSVARSYVTAPLRSAITHSGVGAGGIAAWTSVPLTVTDSAWDPASTGEPWSSGGVAMTDAALRDPGEPLFATWGAPWVLGAGDLPVLDFE